MHASARRWMVVGRVCALLLCAVSPLAGGTRASLAERGATAATAGRQDGAAMVGFRGDAARTGRQPGLGPAAAPTERWRFAVPFDPNDPVAAELAEFLVLSSPAVVDGVVYTGSLDGALYAIDAADGGQRWRFASGAIGSVDGVAVAGGTVYAGAQGGIVLAVDAAGGTERWRFELGPGSAANVPLPAIADGVVYAGGGEGVLVALDAGSGQERWRATIGGQAIGPPAVTDGLVFATAAADIGGGNAELVAIETAGGGERWRVAVGGLPLRAAAAAAGGLVYVPATTTEGKTTLLALDAASGAERWRFDTGGFVVGNPATADGKVFVATNHALIALDGATGLEAWRVEGVETGLLSAPGPVVADGAVYLFAGQVDAIADTASGVVLAVEATTGAERWRYTTDFAPGLLSSWDIAVAGGAIFVPATGFLVALG